jgi:glycerate kinase
MFVVCAPDSFKGTISAPQAAQAMARGALAAGHDAIAVPVADGGEGTGDVLRNAMGGSRHTATTLDPLGRTLQGHWDAIGATVGLVETAVASGLGLLSAPERTPMQHSSIGTGVLIAAAHRAGMQDVLVAVGGTGTVDGGCGLLQGLGVQWLDAAGNVLPSPITPEHIHAIASYTRPKQLPQFEVLVDTTAPLLGKDGAATVFAPQKGASPADVRALELALLHLAGILDPNGETRTLPGAGAGGGIAFALAAMGGTIRSGSAYVLDAIDFTKYLATADCVLTGEGCLDGQTSSGKAPLAVANAATKANVPCLALAGMLGEGHESLLQANLFHACTSLLDHVPIEEAMGDPIAAIERVTKAMLNSFDFDPT